MGFLALLAALAFAENDAPVCENDSAKDGYCVQDCAQFEDEFHKNGVENIAEAVRTVKDCLIDRGLNPAMGRDVLARLNGWRFECGLPGRGVRAGAVTDHEKKLVLVYVPEAPIVFHELEHVADPPSKGGGDTYKYITTTDRHHAAFGNPDPVYGCQIACFPELIHQKKNFRGGRQASARDVQIPESERGRFAAMFPDECGEGAGDACIGLEKYAYLCRAGSGPSWKKLPGVH